MKVIRILTILFICSSFTKQTIAQELEWPREIETDNYLITIYQPQLESFKKNILEGRMAISIKPENDDLLFCSAWFKAVMETDLNERIVVLNSIQIPKIHFPNVDDTSKIEQLSKLLEDEITSWNVEMSIDRLTASLADADVTVESVQLNNTPPDIYFRTSPSLIVSIDGDPIVKSIENTNLEYVVNTPFFIVNKKGENDYYIKGGKFWYNSNDRLNGWKETNNIPSDIKKLADENLSNTEQDSITAAMKTAPKLIVVTKPSELIQTDGEPDYQAIGSTSLLYVENSESDIIMDINSQNHYILLAGRWYSSKSLEDGNWKFCEPDDLPKDFSEIPDNSDMADVRASIPGTPESQDALLEQSIPQTATVDRSSASVEVKYDGNPEFKKIDGAEVAYAINSDKTILRIKGKYYCVDNAIWFISDNAAGPWKVSDVRPDEVDDIPASSEVYNVKYVYIYDSTPEVVYVGYYPGYCHSYVYRGVVVYGTGYRYHPWYRHYYYPRPVTWGFGVHWNPYTGWGFSMGFSYGWVGWRFHPYYRPYWGPRGYHHGYRHGYNRGYRHGYRAGYRYANRPRPTPYNNRNVYRNRVNSGVKTRDIKRARPTDRMVNSKVRPSTKPNNIFSDRQGNIHQRNKDGSWQQKQNRKADRPTNVTRPSTERPVKQPKIQQRPSNNNKTPKPNIQRPNNTQQRLDRSFQNRSRGAQNYNRSRSSGTNRSGTGTNRSRTGGNNRKR